MKILLVKMSSMGDIFHTFPAISDLKAQHPTAEIHWLVETGFAEIAAWHPGVDRVIPIALRHWMKHKTAASFREFRAFRRELRLTQYDLVIDAQGLLKSGLMAAQARGTRHGFDKTSAREAVNSWFMQKGHAVSREQHAVTRTRALIAKVLGYTPSAALNFGIQAHFAAVKKVPQKLVFIIGTSWTTKLWALNEWIALTERALSEGFSVEIMWGSESERALAQQIIDACPAATRPQERMSITKVAENLVSAQGVVGLDTGFSHLAGALEIPTIAIYGPTSPVKVGLIGDHTCNLRLSPPLECMPCHKRQCKLQSPDAQARGDVPKCMSRISATDVWRELTARLALGAAHPSNFSL